MLELESKKQETINNLEREMISKSLSFSINYRAWYVGVTEDPEVRSRQHGVSINFIFRYTGSESVSRAVERYFVDKGCDGGLGGGINPNYVYVFLKN